MKLLVPLLAALLAMPAFSSAAVILWNYKLIPDSAAPIGVLDWDGNVRTDGTLVAAQNSGGMAGNYGGVEFAAGTFSFGSTSSAYYNVNPSNGLANTGTWAGTGAGTLTLDNTTVGGTGLIVGQQYLVQLFFADARPSSSGRAISIDGGERQPFAFNSGTFPILSAEGVFTANDIFQNITLEAFVNATTGATIGPQLNGFQLRAVPEPGLLALTPGVFALLLRKRRA